MNLGVGDFQVFEKDGYVHALHIPIFDEHERDGIKYDEARLSRIAENNNCRIADTGDLVPLVPGHAPDGKPEEATTILGWASNFQIGTWGIEQPRPCIFADFKFPLDMWEIARGLPRRSVELIDYTTDQAFIDPIALLGGTTPYRDLGLLYSRKKSSSTTIYRYELNGGSMDKEELVKLVCECITNSDVGKWAAEKMKCEASEKAAEDKPAEDTADEDKPAEYEADDKEDKPADEDDDKEKLKNQRDQEQRKYARLEADHKLLSSRLADLERKERISTRKADLLGIEAEGVLFEMAEELDTVSDLDDKSYARHLDKMRKRYSRSPIGVKVPVQAMPAHGVNVSTTELTSDQVQQAAELMLSGKAKNKDEAFNLVRGI